MIDPIKAVIAWLKTDSSITALATGGIYGGNLPEKYNDPDSMGPAITVKVRGGSSHELIPIIYPSIQIECWAGQMQFLTARTLYALIYDALHGYNNITIGDTVVMSSVEEVQGQDTTDPDTGWATVVSFFRMTMRATNS